MTNRDDFYEYERRRNVARDSYTMNKIHVCVDVQNKKEIRGRVYHENLPQARYFEGAAQLLLSIEDFLDEANYPAKSTENRYFIKPRKYDMPDEPNAVENREKGKRATFIVQVQYRQNSTWQGKVKWIEKDLEHSFRSALELIKLIDSSIEET